MGKRQVNRLTPVAVNAKKAPGHYPDGNGLYLQVSESGSKSWVLRFTLNKRSREMGLGSIHDRTLAQARDAARLYRQKLADGIDPIEYRRNERAANLLATAKRRTFKECANEYRNLHASGWKNAKHADQWINTLTAYAFPVFGDKDVSAVTKGDILQALEPIWTAKPETASRTKQRIRAVLDWAAARDYRTNHDPHLWDQVARALPKTKDIKKSKHFEACPYPDIHSALASIKQSGATDVAKLALEFIVLTAARSGEVRGARWSEIDFEGKRWIIPPARMEASREHRVPLSERAIEILKLRRNAAKSETTLLTYATDSIESNAD